MFGWLLGKKKEQAPAKKSKSPKASSGLALEALDSVLPDFAHEGEHMKSALEEASDRALQQRREQRKADRMGRREALFGVVREVMLRSGILSSAYKFKVLSIDQKGRHFLVLLDLAETEPAERLVEIEKMIRDTAMSRMQVVVQSVYWRHFVPGQTAAVHLSTGDTQPGGLSASVRTGGEAAAPEKAGAAGGTEKGFENSAADAISAALAELRAKNRARVQERAAEHLAQAAAREQAPMNTDVQTAASGASAAASFVATQVITRAQSTLAGAASDTQMFPETQMHQPSRLGATGQADDEELAAFQRALQGVATMDDAPASIFVSGRALDALRDTGPGGLGLDEHFADGGVDLSGTQYGELPKF